MVAKVVISLDFELGWGVLEDPLWKERQNNGLYKRLRPVLADLFTYLESTELSTTWASVSSMSIERYADLSIDHLPNDYKDATALFFKEAEWETRCANDLFDSWAKISDFSELASHTSTHIYADHSSVKSEHYVADIKDSIDTLERYFSHPISSLIFPRDQADFRTEIAQQHPLNFRLNPAFFKNKKNKLQRIVAGGAKFWDNIPSSQVFLGNHGEIYQSGSMYLNWSGGDFERLKKILVLIQIERLIKQLPHTNNIFHIWLHPFNLAESTKHYEVFISFLKALVDLRDKGIIDVVTMKDVTSPCNIKGI